MIICAIWNQLDNSKNLKNILGGVLVNLSDFSGVFHVFLNCTNVTKPCKVSHLLWQIYHSLLTNMTF